MKIYLFVHLYLVSAVGHTDQQTDRCTDGQADGQTDRERGRDREKLEQLLWPSALKIC